MKIFSYRYLPLNIYLGYSFFVLVSLVIGPIQYKDINYLVLLPFLAIMIFLFALGFVAGARGSYRHYPVSFDVRLFSYNKIGHFISVLLFLALIGALAQWYHFFVSGAQLNLGNIGSNYVKGYENYERGQAQINILYILNIFDQALATLVLLFSLYYFKAMRKFAKYVFLFVVITYLLINVIGTGKQKYFGDVVIYSFFCMTLNFAAKARKFRLRTVFLVTLSAMFVFFIFIEILRQRYQAAGIGLDNIYEKAHPLIIWDESSLVFNLVSSDYALALGIFLGYFTSGLYGLYLSLTLSFEWSYFIGNSYSLGRIAEIILSSDGSVLGHTYPYRVGEIYGWGFDKWHSLFAWLASDVSFVGVLFLTPLFACFYGKLWLQAIKASNPFSGPLFIYLSLGLIFSYANNQLMHGLAGIIVLVVLLLGWTLSLNLRGLFFKKNGDFIRNDGTR